MKEQTERMMTTLGVAVSKGLIPDDVDHAGHRGPYSIHLSWYPMDGGQAWTAAIWGVVPSDKGTEARMLTQYTGDTPDDALDRLTRYVLDKSVGQVDRDAQTLEGRRMAIDQLSRLVEPKADLGPHNQ